MSESLVVIRTFGNLLDADEAQIELLMAGVYSLLYSDDSSVIHPSTPPGQGIALAVHQRDVELAEVALSARHGAALAPPHERTGS
jgi:hypothetical protein